VCCFSGQWDAEFENALLKLADCTSAAALERSFSPLLPEKVCNICCEVPIESELLLCDLCNSETHMTCAGLAIPPPGEWLCTRCQKCGPPASTAFFCSSNTELRKFRRTLLPLMKTPWWGERCDGLLRSVVPSHFSVVSNCLLGPLKKWQLDNNDDSRGKKRVKKRGII